MKLSQFKFKLPEEQVALEPTFHRDECRLMVVHRKSGRIEMTRKDENGEELKDKEGNPVYLDFRNIIDYFDEDDTFIFNDTQVFPARLYGTKEKTDAKIEVFLLRELNPDLRLWDVLVEPARKIRIGNKLFFEEDGPMVAEVIDNTTSRGRTLRFLYDCPHDEFKRELFALGAAPLPRYIIDYFDEDDTFIFNDTDLCEERGCGDRSGHRAAFQPRTDEAHGDPRHQLRLHHSPLRLGQLRPHRGGRPHQA